MNLVRSDDVLGRTVAQATRRGKVSYGSTSSGWFFILTQMPGKRRGSTRTSRSTCRSVWCSSDRCQTTHAAKTVGILLADHDSRQSRLCQEVSSLPVPRRLHTSASGAAACNALFVAGCDRSVYARHLRTGISSYWLQQSLTERNRKSSTTH